MIQIDNCIFPNEKELIFINGSRDFRILEIDCGKNSFLLEGFNRHIPIEIFFNVNNFHKFVKEYFPEFYC